MYSFQCSEYRFGFNGKEVDNSIKGQGNSLDFGARIYDSRLGRWLSTDPLQIKYPALSPYNFVGNMSIIAIDPDGKKIIVTGSPEYQEQVRSQIQKLTNDKVIIKEGVIYLVESGMGTQNQDKTLTKGTSLIKQLNSKEEGAYTVEIRESTVVPLTVGPNGDKTVRGGPAYIKDDGTPGVGEGSTILFDANRETFVKEEGISEKVKAKNEIVLGHELIHSKHRWDGTKPDGLTKKINPDHPENFPSIVDGKYEKKDGNERFLFIKRGGWYSSGGE